MQSGDEPVAQRCGVGERHEIPEPRAIGNTLRKPGAVEYRHGTRSAQLHHSGRGDAAGSDHVGVVVAVAAVADVRRQTIAGHTSVGSPRPGRSSEDIAGRQDRARVDQPAPAEQLTPAHAVVLRALFMNCGLVQNGTAARPRPVHSRRDRRPLRSPAPDKERPCTPIQKS